jgi:hypothetical protein
VAIDRATRWVFMHIYGDKTFESSVDLLWRLKLGSSINFYKILFDKRSQFTDRFPIKDKKPSSDHAFNQTCTSIDYRLCGIHKPMEWWNGLMAASRSCCEKPDLTVRLTWKRLCSANSSFISITSYSVPVLQESQLRGAITGSVPSPNYS